MTSLGIWRPEAIEWILREAVATNKLQGFWEGQTCWASPALIRTGITRYTLEVDSRTRGLVHHYRVDFRVDLGALTWPG